MAGLVMYAHNTQMDTGQFHYREEHITSFLLESCSILESGGSARIH